MTPEAQKRFIQSQIRNADFWDSSADSHEKSAEFARKQAKQCRDDVAFFTARLEREAAKENG